MPFFLNKKSINANQSKEVKDLTLDYSKIEIALKLFVGKIGYDLRLLLSSCKAVWVKKSGP